MLMVDRNRITFPLFNAVLGMIFGGLVGYYIFAIGLTVLAGALIGFLIGLLVESLTFRFGPQSWAYRRRVLLVALLEVPLVFFILGPLAYVVNFTRPNHHPVCCETPLDYGAAEYESVEIETEDGIVLTGWYVPPSRQPGPVIVLLHGAGGDRRGTAWHARQLIETGYGVLMFDSRALGESTGERVTMGWQEGYDLLAVLDYLEARPDVDPERIGAVGLSAGAHIALNAAYLEPGRFSALWLDGMQAQRIADFPEQQNFREQFATAINLMIFKMSQAYLRMPAPPAFIEILPVLDQPEIVLIAGGLDDFERRANQQYALAAGENVELWLIEDAYHVGGPSVIPDEYRARMLNFFAAALGE